MSGHTPGPWSLRHRPSGPWTVYVPAMSDSGRERFYNGIWIHQGDNEADARLIAAAPELLEALKLAQDWLSTDDPEWEVRVAVDAAIAKAEGR